MDIKGEHQIQFCLLVLDHVKLSQVTSTQLSTTPREQLCENGVIDLHLP